MSASYLIDGVGDEVTVVLGIFLAVFVVIVSWISTRVNDEGTGAFEVSDVVNAADIIRIRPSQQIPETRAEGLETATPLVPNETQETNDNDVVVPPYPSETPIESTNVTSTSVSEPILSENVLRHRTTNQTDASSSTADAAVESTSEQTLPTSSDNTNLITIRLKFMNDRMEVVQANPDETLDQFRRRNFPPETANRYRLIYGGQVLRDGASKLSDLRLDANTAGDSEAIPVIHCFLSPATAEGGDNAATSASRQLEMAAEELHIGSFFLPIVGVVLLCLWYLCIFYTSLFSIQSLVSILGLTFLYIVLLVNMFL